MSRYRCPTRKAVGLERQPNSLTPVGDPQLAVNGTLMRADSVNRDKEHLANLGCGHGRAQISIDLTLPRRQRDAKCLALILSARTGTNAHGYKLLVRGSGRCVLNQERCEALFAQGKGTQDPLGDRGIERPFEVPVSTV